MAPDTTSASDLGTTDPTPRVSASTPGLRGWLARSALSGWDLTVLGAVVVVAVVAAVMVPSFASASNVSFLLLDVVAIGLIALPMTLIIVTGEIDLSVASALGLTSALMGQLWESNVPILTVMSLCILAGALLGAFNGGLVTMFGLPSLAVTIGTLALYRGLAFVVLGSRAVASFPTTWTSFATSDIPGTPIPVPFAIMLGLALVFGVVLHATPTGRGLFAMGASEEAAVFSGVAVARTKFALFVVSGAVAGLAGVFWTLRYASARADNAAGLELSVVAAVLLGGVSIFGGRGALPGVLGGVLLLGTLTNALQLASVSADNLTIVTGLLLIVSVVAPNVLDRVRSRVRRRSPGS